MTNRTPLNWSLTNIATQLGVEYQNTPLYVQGISTDTRTLKAGDAYLALVGERFDGHDFVQQAEQNGAVALIVSQAVESTLPQLLVKDTLIAYGQLAKAWRKQFAIPVIGVTGSCGKTSVKTILKRILSEVSSSVLATEKNFNNEVGVPKTLFELSASDEYAVIEMGASHPEDIRYLADIALPTISLVTNVAPAHLEGFGRLEDIAKAKGELFLPHETTPIAIINRDDEYYPFWRNRCVEGQTVLTFGQNEQADVRLVSWSSSGQQTQMTLVLPDNAELSLSTRLVGLHNALNITACIAAVWPLNIQPALLKHAIRDLTAPEGRLCYKQGVAGMTVIDDSYNANPLSMTAALEVLADCSGETIFVMGDMAELGEQSDAYHQAIGQRAKALGVNQMLSVGEKSYRATEAFGEQGYHFQTIAEAADYLKQSAQQNMTVLVKGSRSAAMEQVVQAIIVTETHLSGAMPC